MFITYKTFNDPALANELIEHFAANGVEFETEDDSKIFDASFFHNEVTRVIAVKIRQEDFSKANDLIYKISREELNDINKDYYLYSMTDQELIEIIKKPDEWTPLDFELATKILRERNIELAQSQIEELKQKRKTELLWPDKSLTNHIYFAWFLIVAGSIFWLIGTRPMYIYLNLIGVIIGLGIHRSKKTMPDGRQIFRYNAGDRKQGKLISIVGIILLISSSILYLLIYS